MNLEEKYRVELCKLGERIRKIREKKGYSQEVLGFKANLHRNYVSSLELAQKNPSYTTLLKIADALSISITDLISQENDNGAKNKK